MSQPNGRMTVHVDVTNPGQFFACCGLLELAHRLWPGAEGWFDSGGTVFHIHASADRECTIRCLMETLVNAGIAGELSNQEREELEKLESKKRTLKKQGKDLSEAEEERRASLGERQREGALFIGDPFRLRVAWWQEEGEDVPKTFAGRQEVLRMATAMLSEVCNAVENDRPFEYRCLLQAVSQGSQGTNVARPRRARNSASKVEPFYFDSERFAHALDAGFSLDVQAKSMRASAAPLTELLALIGLQRFRPAKADNRWSFEYWTWTTPLCPTVAATAACGAVMAARGQGYRFTLRFRDDQKRYKAFDFAIPIGGNV